ncbi:porin PorA family protein [Corynebacterium mendelii]|uniref:DUF3068 domain-containing protein n=1 Tax=Corynebacterium mendelii TaxID=2765362 RepID=A0A939ITJ6_9CORY|nr:porin PorA family protein [Corynebacterium mendelii]MBN9643924.1 DUF3068 domain-containing protein [Corynebacterium mendelii]
MLPKSRLFAVLLLGVGVALVTAAILAGWFMHSDSRMQLSPARSTMTLVDNDATVYDPVAGTSDKHQQVVMQRHVTITDPVSPTSAAVRIGYAWLKGNGDPAGLLDASIWSYHINRISGMQESDTVIASVPGFPPSQHDFQALSIHFPSNPDTDTLPVLDPFLRAAFPANRTATVEQGGRTIDTWHQVIRDEIVAEHYAATGNTLTLPAGPALKHYSAVRDLQVDRQSGIIIAETVHITEKYVPVDGGDPVTGLDFRATTPTAERSEMANRAALVPTGQGFSATRILLGAGGCVLIIVGGIGVFGAFGRLPEAGRKKTGTRKK